MPVLTPSPPASPKSVTPKRCVVRRGENKAAPSPIIRVPKSQRTPLVDEIIKQYRRTMQQCNTLRSQYIKKCSEVTRMKKKQTPEGALEILQSEVSPRFFTLLRAEVRNYHRTNGHEWHDDELAEMEAIRQRGPQAFMGLPMVKPTANTMRKRFDALDLKPGINPSIMAAMKAKDATMDEKERICFEACDEMSLKACLTLMQDNDLVAGYFDMGNGDRRPELAEEVMVAMVRSVYGTWKMPFAFWYTNKTANATDFSVMFHDGTEALLLANYDCRALVSDALQKNIAGEHLLGATYDEPWFFVLGKKIYTIADVPHLMKSLRNAPLIYLLQLGDGTLVDIKCVTGNRFKSSRVHTAVSSLRGVRPAEPCGQGCSELEAWVGSSGPAQRAALPRRADGPDPSSS